MIYRLCLVLLLIYGGVRFYYRLTDDFRLSNIVNPFPNESTWTPQPLAQHDKEFINNILKQKFYYLGKGAQAYAFGSEDDQYVIKFFKFKHLKPSVMDRLLGAIPVFKQYSENQKVNKRIKLINVYSGYEIAFDKHRDDSGLLLLHFGPIDSIDRIVTLYDKVGWRRDIALPPTVFVIQRKVRTFRNELIELLDREEIDVAMTRIRSVIDLYLSEYQKGIYDRDHGVLHNVGFINEKPIHIDVGKMSSLEAMKDLNTCRIDLQFIVDKIDIWLKNTYSNYHQRIMDDISQKLEEIFGADLAQIGNEPAFSNLSPSVLPLQCAA